MEKMPAIEKPPEEKIEEKDKRRFRGITNRAVFEMMYEEKNLFPSEVQVILEKKKNQEETSLKERTVFNLARRKWWFEKFGFEGYPDRAERREKEKEEIGKKKEKIMENLNLALKNLDNGEAVEQFKEEDRRVLYFDEDKNQYFVLENDTLKHLGVGDVLSDYAWGIKYVPDGEMMEPEYRRIAKRILTNETRRDLEKLYDRELILIDIKSFLNNARQQLQKIEKQWLVKLKGNQDITEGEFLGVISEVMASEVLSRLSQNEDLDFIVERANVLEDSMFKYDFKVRSRKKRRGIGVGNEKDIEDRIKKIGIQFTVGRKTHKGRKERGELIRIKETYRGKLPVDEIILVRIVTKEFGDAYSKWLLEGKPSGGPEQFLPEEIKNDLLEKVTEGLF